MKQQDKMTIWRLAKHSLYQFLPVFPRFGVLPLIKPWFLPASNPPQTDGTLQWTNTPYNSMFGFGEAYLHVFEKYADY